MKREEFIKHLRLHGCEFLREGGNHTVYVILHRLLALNLERSKAVDADYGTIHEPG